MGGRKLEACRCRKTKTGQESSWHRARFSLLSLVASSYLRRERKNAVKVKAKGGGELFSCLLPNDRSRKLRSSPSVESVRLPPPSSSHFRLSLKHSSRLLSFRVPRHARTDGAADTTVASLVFVTILAYSSVTGISLVSLSLASVSCFLLLL